MDKPNPLRAGWSIGAALLRIRPPFPTGTGQADVEDLDAVLGRLRDDGIPALAAMAPQVRSVVERLAGLDPDGLSSPGALAFWLNVYNAGALLLAGRALENGSPFVMRIPGGFSEPFVPVAGEWLSLDAIEHAKIRRFGDTRVNSSMSGISTSPRAGATPHGSMRIARTKASSITGGIRRA
ncbi:MAG: DUF547 domain-containing protein [Acidimicrobiia bacterium]|nr:DUF547 domain-containing protein [Acidimicrobiia bacterium]